MKVLRVRLAHRHMVPGRRDPRSGQRPVLGFHPERIITVPSCRQRATNTTGPALTSRAGSAGRSNTSGRETDAETLTVSGRCPRTAAEDERWSRLTKRETISSARTSCRRLLDRRCCPGRALYRECPPRSSRGGPPPGRTGGGPACLLTTGLPKRSLPRPAQRWRQAWFGRR